NVAGALGARRGGIRLADGVDHIFARDPAFGTGAAHSVQVDAQLARQAANGRPGGGHAGRAAAVVFVRLSHGGGVAVLVLRRGTRGRGGRFGLFGGFWFLRRRGGFGRLWLGGFFFGFRLRGFFFRWGLGLRFFGRFRGG